MKKKIRERLYNFYEQYDPYGFSDYASEYDNPMEAISEMDPETIIDWLADIVEEDDDFAEEAQDIINMMMAEFIKKGESNDLQKHEHRRVIHRDRTEEPLGAVRP